MPQRDLGGLSVEEKAGVKVNRKIGPVDSTLDAFKKIGTDPNIEVLSFAIGEQIFIN